MPTVEQFKEKFRNAYEKKTILKRNSMPDTPAPIVSHKIYNYLALSQLIERLKAIKPDELDEEEDRLQRYAVRYVIDTNGVIWFAQEGPTGSYVPNHYQMCSTVYAAGNLYFSDDYQEIIEISNKSGHFKPSSGTLVWSIGTLLALQAPFSNQIRIQWYNKNSTVKEATNCMTVSLETLESLLPCPIENFYIAQDRIVVEETKSEEDEELASFFTYGKKRKSQEELYAPQVHQSTVNSGLSLLGVFSTSATSSLGSCVTPPRCSTPINDSVDSDDEVERPSIL